MVFKFYPFSEECILVENIHSEQQRGILQMRHRLSDEIAKQGSIASNSVLVQAVRDDDDDDDLVLGNINASISMQECSSSTSTSRTTSAYFSCSDSTTANVACGGWTNSSKLDDDDDEEDARSHGCGNRLNESDSDLEQFDSCSVIDDDDDFYISVYLQRCTEKSDRVFKVDLIKSLCAQIDSKYANLRTVCTTNCIDLKFNPTFWNYVLHDLGLMGILNSNSSSSGSRTTTSHVEQLRVDLDRLLATLRRLETELANYAVDHTVTYNEHHKNDQTIMFEAEFVLNLTFVVFEQALVLLASNASHERTVDSAALVFELENEVSDIDYAFETKLNELMNNWILIYLPSMINKVIRQGDQSSCGSGKSIIEFFKCLFKSNTFTSSTSTSYGRRQFEKRDSPLLNSCNESYYDIENYIHTPHCSSERIEFNAANQISKSFTTLADNLIKLDYYTSDPMGSMYNESMDNAATTAAADYLTMDSDDAPTTFAHLLASYYTMGAFELRTLLFENTYQPLHEVKMFEQECIRVFDHSDEELTCNGLGLMNTTPKNISSMWSYSEHETGCAETCSPSEATHQNEENPKWGLEKQPCIIEDILNRIEAMIRSAVDNESPQPARPSTSLFKPCIGSGGGASGSNQVNAKLGSGETNEKTAISQSTRSWTVAPKTFQSIVDVSSTACSSQFSSSVVSDKRVWQTQSILTRSDYLRPIGTKPTSMLAPRGGNQLSNIHCYRNVKCVNVNSTTAKRKKVDVSVGGFACDTTWRMSDTAAATATSPFVVYETSHSLTDGSFSLNEIIDLKKLRPQLLAMTSQSLSSSSSSSMMLPMSITTTMPVNIPAAAGTPHLSGIETVKTRKYSVAPFFMLDNHFSHHYQSTLLQQSQYHPNYNHARMVHHHPSAYHHRKSISVMQPQQQTIKRNNSDYSPPSSNIPAALSFDKAIVSVTMSQPRCEINQSYTQPMYHIHAHNNGMVFFKQSSLDETIASTYKYSSNLSQTSSKRMDNTHATNSNETNARSAAGSQKTSQAKQHCVEATECYEYKSASKNGSAKQRQHSSKWNNNRY